MISAIHNLLVRRGFHILPAGPSPPRLYGDRQGNRVEASPMGDWSLSPRGRRHACGIGAAQLEVALDHADIRATFRCGYCHRERPDTERAKPFGITTPACCSACKPAVETMIIQRKRTAR